MKHFLFGLIICNPLILLGNNKVSMVKVQCDKPPKSITGKPMPRFFWEFMKKREGCFGKETQIEKEKAYALNNGDLYGRF